jgi:UDP-N-acetyl-D-galactosamine dehydrogenase
MLTQKVAVIGLGYVGLPVAVALAETGAFVTGFDLNRARIQELAEGSDRTREIDQATLRRLTIRYTASIEDLKDCDFFIVTVPTPIDEALRPDLTMLLSAAGTVGQVLKKGDVVVFESTVYPGATEEECIPVMEKASGLKAGRDFGVGYSPERINPGDKTHRLATIRKVISALDKPTLQKIAEVYGAIVTAGLYHAPSIKVAEAAKVIENAQRDLNIAFVNELSGILEKLGLDTQEVLDAAATKWNFLNFRPGLVGGHCIGVDPFYLAHKATMVGWHPEIILAGRRINDSVGERVAARCVERLVRGRINNRRVTILGVTFKEDVPDVRNSKVFDIVGQLRNFGLEVQLHDPIAVPQDVVSEYGVPLLPLDQLRPAGGLIMAVAHNQYRCGGWDLATKCLEGGRGPVLDLKGILDRQAIPSGIDLWRL